MHLLLLGNFKNKEKKVENYFLNHLLKFVYQRIKTKLNFLMLNYLFAKIKIQLLKKFNFINQFIKIIKLKDVL